jgi:hypothetical protein
LITSLPQKLKDEIEIMNEKIAKYQNQIFILQHQVVEPITNLKTVFPAYIEQTKYLKEKFSPKILQLKLDYEEQLKIILKFKNAQLNLINENFLTDSVIKELENNIKNSKDKELSSVNFFLILQKLNDIQLSRVERNFQVGEFKNKNKKILEDLETSIENSIKRENHLLKLEHSTKEDIKLSKAQIPESYNRYLPYSISLQKKKSDTASYIVRLKEFIEQSSLCQEDYLTTRNKLLFNKNIQENNIIEGENKIRDKINLQTLLKFMSRGYDDSDESEEEKDIDEEIDINKEKEDVIVPIESNCGNIDSKNVKDLEVDSQKYPTIESSNNKGIIDLKVVERSNLTCGDVINYQKIEKAANNNIQPIHSCVCTAYYCEYVAKGSSKITKLPVLFNSRIRSTSKWRKLSALGHVETKKHAIHNIKFSFFECFIVIEKAISSLLSIKCIDLEIAKLGTDQLISWRRQYKLLFDKESENEMRKLCIDIIHSVFKLSPKVLFVKNKFDLLSVVLFNINALIGLIQNCTNKNWEHIGSSCLTSSSAEAMDMLSIQLIELVTGKKTTEDFDNINESDPHNYMNMSFFNASNFLKDLKSLFKQFMIEMDGYYSFSTETLEFFEKIANVSPHDLSELDVLSQEDVQSYIKRKVNDMTSSNEELSQEFTFRHRHFIEIFQVMLLTSSIPLLKLSELTSSNESSYRSFSLSYISKGIYSSLSNTNAVNKAFNNIIPTTNLEQLFELGSPQLIPGIIAMDLFKKVLEEQLSHTSLLNKIANNDRDFQDLDYMNLTLSINRIMPIFSTQLKSQEHVLSDDYEVKTDTSCELSNKFKSIEDVHKNWLVGMTKYRDNQIKRIKDSFELKTAEGSITTADALFDILPINSILQKKIFDFCDELQAATTVVKQSHNSASSFINNSPIERIRNGDLFNAYSECIDYIHRQKFIISSLYISPWKRKILKLEKKYRILCMKNSYKSSQINDSVNEAKNLRHFAEELEISFGKYKLEKNLIPLSLFIRIMKDEMNKNKEIIQTFVDDSTENICHKDTIISMEDWLDKATIDIHKDGYNGRLLSPTAQTIMNIKSVSKSQIILEKQISSMHRETVDLRMRIRLSKIDLKQLETRQKKISNELIEISVIDHLNNKTSHNLWSKAENLSKLNSIEMEENLNNEINISIEKKDETSSVKTLLPSMEVAVHDSVDNQDVTSPILKPPAPYHDNSLKEHLQCRLTPLETTSDDQHKNLPSMLKSNSDESSHNITDSSQSIIENDPSKPIDDILNDYIIVPIEDIDEKDVAIIPINHIFINSLPSLASKVCLKCHTPLPDNLPADSVINEHKIDPIDSLVINSPMNELKLNTPFSDKVHKLNIFDNNHDDISFPIVNSSPLQRTASLSSNEVCSKCSTPIPIPLDDSLPIDDIVNDIIVPIDDINEKDVVNSLLSVSSKFCLKCHTPLPDNLPADNIIYENKIDPIDSLVINSPIDDVKFLPSKTCSKCNTSSSDKFFDFFASDFVFNIIQQVVTDILENCVAKQSNIFSGNLVEKHLDNPNELLNKKNYSISVEMIRKDLISPISLDQSLHVEIPSNKIVSPIIKSSPIPPLVDKLFHKRHERMQKQTLLSKKLENNENEEMQVSQSSILFSMSAIFGDFSIDSATYDPFYEVKNKNRVESMLSGEKFSKEHKTFLNKMQRNKERVARNLMEIEHIREISLKNKEKQLNLKKSSDEKKISMNIANILKIFSINSAKDNSIIEKDKFQRKKFLNILLPPTVKTAESTNSSNDNDEERVKGGRGVLTYTPERLLPTTPIDYLFNNNILSNYSPSTFILSSPKLTNQLQENEIMYSKERIHSKEKIKIDAYAKQDSFIKQSIEKNPLKEFSFININETKNLSDENVSSIKFYDQVSSNKSSNNRDIILLLKKSFEISTHKQKMKSSILKNTTINLSPFSNSLSSLPGQAIHYSHNDKKNLLKDSNIKYDNILTKKIQVFDFEKIEKNSDSIYMNSSVYLNCSISPDSKIFSTHSSHISPESISSMLQSQHAKSLDLKFNVPMRPQIDKNQSILQTPHHSARINIEK